MRIGMDNCKEIIDLLGDYLDGDLPADRRHAFEGHMNDCPPCLEFLDSIRDTRSLAESLRCEAIPEPVRKSLRAFLDRERKDRSS